MQVLWSTKCHHWILPLFQKSGFLILSIFQNSSFDRAAMLPFIRNQGIKDPLVHLKLMSRWKPVNEKGFRCFPGTFWLNRQSRNSADPSVKTEKHLAAACVSFFTTDLVGSHPRQMEAVFLSPPRLRHLASNGLRGSSSVVMFLTCNELAINSEAQTAA